MSTIGSDTESSSLGSSQRRKGVIDTRRAEQNRAAQRAFRQRKERYVKELENKVRDMQGLQERLEKLEDENAHLRQRLWELAHRPAVAAASEAPPPESLSSWTPNNTTPTTSTDEQPPSQQQTPSALSRSLPGTSSAKRVSASPPPKPLAHHHHHHHRSRYHPYSPPHTLPPPPTSSSRSTSNGPTLRLSDQRTQTKLPVISPRDEPGTPGSDKGLVLDNLITILRSRNRPPIPSQAAETVGSSSRSPSGPPPPIESKQIETTIH